MTEILRSPTNLPTLSVVVNCTNYSRDIYCRIKIGELGKATIVGGWKAVAKKFDLKEGEICMFSFRDERAYQRKWRDNLAWLRLVITKLYVRLFLDINLLLLFILLTLFCLLMVLTNSQ